MKKTIRDVCEVFSLLHDLTKKLIEKGLRPYMGEYITNEPVRNNDGNICYHRDIFYLYSKENWNWKEGRLVIRVGVEPLESSTSFFYLGLCLYDDRHIRKDIYTPREDQGKDLSKDQSYAHVYLCDDDRKKYIDRKKMLSLIKNISGKNFTLDSDGDKTDLRFLFSSYSHTSSRKYTTEADDFFYKRNTMSKIRKGEPFRKKMIEGMYEDVLEWAEYVDRSVDNSKGN